MKTFTQDTLDKIKECTSDNLHTESLIVIAKELGSKKLQGALKGIQAIQAYYGHLPMEAAKLRFNLYKDLAKEVKERFSNAEDALSLL